MKIKRIIVDERPTCCAECGFEMEHLCQATGEKIANVKSLKLPSFCPLQLEQTCGNCAYHRQFGDVIGLRCAHTHYGLKDNLGDDYCSRWEAMG